MTREEAIKTLQEEINGNLELSLREWRERDEKELFPALRMAIEALEQLPPAVCDECIWHVCNYNKVDWNAEAVQEWIPCSKGLPPKRESVLLSTNEGFVGEGCYWETTEHHVIWKGYRWNATYWDEEVTAWMPLPKPYREDGEA